MTRTALITGASGQDGSYLAQWLLSQGYRVLGTSRSRSAASPATDDVTWVDWQPTEPDQLRASLRIHRPDEVYHLAAMSSGAGMYDDPVAILDANGTYPARVLEALHEEVPWARFCLASSSEMFGLAVDAPQSEEAGFRPRSPYGAAKVVAHVMVQHFRQRHGMFACSAILYNHESPRRGMGFVTRRITERVAGIKLGKYRDLSLGNLDARRDWGYAPDYVRAMWLMLNHSQARDFVVATGKLHSVRQFCHTAFAHVGLDYRDYVREDPALFRPDEPVPLVGDAGRIRRELGWAPRTTFEDMVGMMVDADLARLSGEG